MKTQTRTVAIINKVKILVVENGQKLVPTRPICQALGIDEDVQKRKIESDEILGSVATLSVATGSDGKQYEMFCLPYKYIFGWLFTINPKNVKEEAREGVINYKLSCYDALYQNFTDQAEFLESQQLLINEQIEILKSAKSNFKNAQSILKEAEHGLDKVRNTTFDEWLLNNRQLPLFRSE